MSRGFWEGQDLDPGIAARKTFAARKTSAWLFVSP